MAAVEQAPAHPDASIPIDDVERAHAELLAAVLTRHALLGADRARYRRLAEDARTFSGTLPSWRVTTWIALFPIGVALVGWMAGALSGLSFSGWKLHDTGDVVTVVIYAVALVYYVVGLVPRAFRRKREYLRAHGLYGREAAVFEALHRRAPRELPVDFILYAIGTGLVVLLGPLVGLVAALPFVDHVKDVPPAAFAAGYIPAFALAVVLWKRWPRGR